LYAVLSCSMLSCPALSCSVLICPILFYAVLSCSMLSCPALSCSVLICPILFYAVLSCPVLCCSVLSCSVLFCSVPLFCSMFSLLHLKLCFIVGFRSYTWNSSEGPCVPDHIPVLLITLQPISKPYSPLKLSPQLLLMPTAHNPPDSLATCETRGQNAIRPQLTTPLPRGRFLFQVRVRFCELSFDFLFLPKTVTVG
jgi:hypothetical protein